MLQGVSWGEKAWNDALWDHAQKCVVGSPNLAVNEGRRVAEKLAIISPKKCESTLLQE